MGLSPVRALPGCATHTQVVVLRGAPDSVHVPGAGFPPLLDDLPGLNESDQQFLRRHAMAW
jgi:hypothetical protein